MDLNAVDTRIARDHRSGKQHIGHDIFDPRSADNIGAAAADSNCNEIPKWMRQLLEPLASCVQVDAGDSKLQTSQFELARPAADADDYSACCRLAAKGRFAIPNHQCATSFSTSESTSVQIAVILSFWMQRSDDYAENRIDRTGLLLQLLDLIEAGRCRSLRDDNKGIVFHL